MNHIPFTLAAYFLNALSVFASKFLLNEAIPDPLTYIFYISLISFLAIFALPFTKIPSPEVFIIASFSTLTWTAGTYFMFKALKIGRVSRVIPVIGTLIPLILLGVAARTNAISENQILAVFILIAGMVILTILDWKGGLKLKELVFEIISAVSFAISYMALRQAYLGGDFFSVIVWSRLILFPLGLIILALPAQRKKIITGNGPSINLLSKTGLIFLGGQISGALSEFLLLFSISLANPALVNSLQGSQYVFLFIFAIILSKKYPVIFGEKYTSLNIMTKICGILAIGLGLYFLAFANN